MNTTMFISVMDKIHEFVNDLPLPVAELVKLQTNNPFKVLISTILTSRTKDETTAQVLPRLFAEVSSFDDLQKINEVKLAKLIYPVGFYKVKAKHLKQLPAIISDRFDGVIPSTVDELVELPGVGRKTANLVVAVAFGKPAICVDVHVHRIINRLGYITTKSPLETEMTLRKKVPEKYWKDINRVFVAFGQHHCKPVSPLCTSCPVHKNCKRVGVKAHR